MNRILTLTSVFIFCFLLLSTLTIAEASTHYVTQNGNGTRSGASLINALSASDFNALMGTGYAGDTFYFSGTFTSRVIVHIGGASSSPITLDGYQGGDCDPINAICNGSANLKKGMEVGAGTTGPDYINIQDFRMTRDDGKNATFTIYAYIYGNDDQSNIDNLIIQRNYVYMSDGTMFYYYQGRNSIIRNNKFYVFGQHGTDATQGVNLINTDDLIVRGNEIGHDEAAYPSGCTSANTIELHGVDNALFEYNDIYGAPQQAGLHPKESFGTQSNIIIRFNKIHNNGTVSWGGKGLYFARRPSETEDYMYVYGNLIYNNAVAGIIVADKANYTRIWSNLIFDNGRIGIELYQKLEPPTNTYIYNNTIARNNTLKDTDYARGGIVAFAGTGIHIKNNILWNNRPSGAGSKYNQIYTSISLSSLESDTYYHSLSTPNFYYGGGFQSLDTMKKIYKMEDAAPVGGVADPGFINPKGPDNVYGTADDDYRLDGKYIDINKGGTLSECFDVSIQGKNYHMCYSDALDPNATNWRTTIPTVRTAKRGASGVWERGAYAYGTGAGSPDINAPQGLQIIVGNN